MSESESSQSPGMPALPSGGALLDSVTIAPAARDPGLRDLVLGVAIIWAIEIVIGLVQAAACKLDFEHIPPWLLAGCVTVSNLCTLWVAWFFICRRCGRSFKEGFAVRSVSRRMVAGSILLGIAAGVLGGLLLDRFGTGESFMAKITATPEGLAAIGIIALLVPPFEEAYYRGFIFPIIRRRIGAAGAILLVTLWFAGVHSFQLAGDWIGIPIIAIMGALWTWQRHVTKSLVPSVICHFSYNAVLMLISIMASDPT